MQIRSRAALAAALVGPLALSACSGDAEGSGSGDGGKTNLAVVGFSVMETPNDALFKAFEETDAGKDVTFDGPAYGASGDMSRGVVDGQDADLVHFSLEPDMTRLVDAGIVADDWKDGDTKGICTQSVVVMVVPKGNPKNIDSWDDLVKDDVSIVTPNPASSGSAKWNLLAAYGSVISDGGSEDDAKAYMTDFFDHVSALPDSGRDATTAFTAGQGDVLLSYENEAILARQNGEDFDYVVPDTTLLIENPCAVTEDAPDVASDFLDYQRSEEGQKLYAGFGFRPLTDVGDVQVEGALDPANAFPEPATELTIDGDFNGWGEANDKFFGDGEDGNTLGIITEIQAGSGVGS
ncbi:sulfate ABC transporter substrate-binding protein [Nocardioides KLBMP 9356]|uniref:Sulfate ABC transporter substrate-binding protein n=1 Tax=Nocardioides potassii TaxID=2911371 RepID=A0ABS9HI26_9ACTN|nr:sulfate ABC transporter substrate-binding protein [Nocardioides potassii]MCF6379981.1 sulfate ABC transporter substrate-binding protein [Nocardioides potassii]